VANDDVTLCACGFLREYEGDFGADFGVFLPVGVNTCFIFRVNQQLKLWFKQPELCCGDCSFAP
jgi:hypothetical protein